MDHVAEHLQLPVTIASFYPALHFNGEEQLVIIRKVSYNIIF
jgi:hypothetical protein